MEGTKRTKDLTAEEILKFSSEELNMWMKRVMKRLYTLVEKRHYDQLSIWFIAQCERGISSAKRGLIELVTVIKERWQEPDLSVVK